METKKQNSVAFRLPTEIIDRLNQLKPKGSTTASVITMLLTHYEDYNNKILPKDIEIAERLARIEKLLRVDMSMHAEILADNGKFAEINLPENE